MIENFKAAGETAVVIWCRSKYEDSHEWLLESDFEIYST
jgi:hypothetical protein